jgi:hypothetical protein
MADKDIRDPVIGPPMILTVLELLFPKRGSYYTDFLLNNLAADEQMIAGP